MKKINFLFVVVLLLLSACEKEEHRIVVLPGDQATPSVLTMEGASDITVTESTSALFPMVLHWTRTDFGNRDIAPLYFIQVDASDNFETPIKLEVEHGALSKALSGATLSELVIKHFGKEGDDEHTKVAINIRVAATIALDNPIVLNYPDTVYSNSLSILVTPYHEAGASAETLYMIGQDFGGWDWGSAEVVEMVPVFGKEGHFWCVSYFTAANGFKWSPKREWNGDFFELGETIGYTANDGNAFVAEDGLYMVYIDMGAGKIALEKARVFGIGDCFGSWDSGKYPFAADGKVMTITTTGEGELRLYAESSIASSDWWTREFIILDGKIVYRGKGDDQERVKVGPGKVVTLDFKKGTGSIK